MSNLPNLITLINLLAGCSATVAFLTGMHNLSLFFFVIALIADFLDGATARLLNVHSELGKQLDSLADLISFGFFPAVMMYDLLSDKTYGIEFQVWALPAFLITAITAIRLGQFNLDESQQNQFKGLPSPANAIFLVGVWIINQQLNIAPNWFYTIIALSSWLLVAPLPMLNLKFTHLKWQGNEFRYIFLLGSLVILVILRSFAPVFIILLYIMISAVALVFLKKEIS